MCGRFTLQITKEMLASIFGVSELPDIQPRYNIAPSQLVLVVRSDPDNTRHLAYLKWGLIPHWAKDASIGNHMINARSETVEVKPAFRSSFKHRRCIIPASGFYEWQKSGNKKRPYYISMKSNEPMLFAGLWDSWKSPEGMVIDSCTILTTNSNELVNPLHNRMPVVLSIQDIGRWMDSSLTDPKELKQLLVPCQSELIQSYPVSEMVNSPRNDTPVCILKTDKYGQH